MLAILKKTGDWQKFKGEPAPAPLLAAEPRRPRVRLFEALGGDDEGKGEAITQKKKAEKKDEAPAESRVDRGLSTCSRRRLSTS